MNIHDVLTDNHFLLFRLPTYYYPTSVVYNFVENDVQECLNSETVEEDCADWANFDNMWTICQYPYIPDNAFTATTVPWDIKFQIIFGSLPTEI